MEGVVELAEEIFHIPVRLGSPQYVSGLSEIISNPIYSTGVGLLLYGQKHQDKNFDNFNDSSSGLLSKMKAWFKKNF